MNTTEIRDWSQDQLVKVREELDRLQKELPEHDAKVNDCYHVLELCSLSASDMVRVASILRKELKARRQCKENISHAACMRDKIQSLADKSNGLLSKSEKRLTKYTDTAQQSLERLRNDW